MSILEQVKDDLKQAMKSGDSLSRDTLRMMISEVNNAKISLGHELSEDEIIVVFFGSPSRIYRNSFENQ